MRLSHGIHLAYCTNIHRGGDWPETFRSLNEHTLRVRDRVSSGKPYAIGLRLGDSASRQLAQADELDKFRAWLEQMLEVVIIAIEILKGVKAVIHTIEALA